jgi:23S rRNA G2069 N7-methylase RlmK/C1962 C5-methylase RlmI
MQHLGLLSVALSSLPAVQRLAAECAAAEVAALRKEHEVQDITTEQVRPIDAATFDALAHYPVQELPDGTQVRLLPHAVAARLSAAQEREKARARKRRQLAAASQAHQRAPRSARSRRGR